MEKFMYITGITLLTLLIIPLPGWSKDVPLFVVQRSKNANEVQYQLHVDDHCHLASKEPVSAFWKLLEDSPEKTEPLSEWEEIAYGVAHQQVEDTWVSFHVRALDQKIIHATATYDPTTETCSPIVHTDIRGQRAVLERIYVQTEEHFLRPKVVYIDIFGKSLDAPPAPVRERITP